MPYLWGRSEELRCLPGIPEFKMQGEDSPVCFAALITTDSVFLPWRKYVSDYVIKTGDESYFHTTRQSISQLQSKKILPEQLQEYSLPISDMLFGHFLFVLIAFIAGAKGFSFLITRHQARKYISELNGIQQSSLEVRGESNDQGIQD